MTPATSTPGHDASVLAQTAVLGVATTHSLPIPHPSNPGERTTRRRYRAQCGAERVGGLTDRCDHRLQSLLPLSRSSLDARRMTMTQRVQPPPRRPSWPLCKRPQRQQPPIPQHPCHRPPAHSSRWNRLAEISTGGIVRCKRRGRLRLLRSKHESSVAVHHHRGFPRRH